ncbi:UDP-glucose dehydrogenase family protein [Terasakiella sp.]|uniref:UDP-glucose dehydrogenase family protein n=1 Tax=Terasakiella sp. TaxID=2034861 RepID=UPI003AA850B2
MKVTVFGIGYVGLVQGAVLAEVGHDVVCVDVDVEKVEKLTQGYIPIYEPGLESLVKTNFEAGRLSFTTDALLGVQHSDVQFIAVGTPPDEDGSADLKYVISVAETIAKYMDRQLLIINKSTVPVGTAEKVRARVCEVLATRGKGNLSFDVVSNPEFLKEGAAINDCMRPDRIIIGTDSRKAEEVMRQLYAPFNRNHEKIIVMDVKSAELTKYAANCILATKISFMNELANLAERLGADIEMVRKGIGSDPRIGYHFIYAGAGYGGSCFPKDVQALIRTAESINFSPDLLKSVEYRNKEQKKVLFKKIYEYFDCDLIGKKFAVWGLSFKPNTDDIREAPSRVLMESLWEAGATVQAYDPEAMNETRRIYGDRTNLSLCSTKEDALKCADALVIITEWRAFKALDFDLIKRELTYPVIFDGRNLFDLESIRNGGVDYISIGRPDMLCGAKVEL